MFKHAKRIVIKTGSNLLAEADCGDLRREWLASLAADIAALHEQRKQVIIVSSGAIALGRHRLKLNHHPLTLEEKQAAAACGQIALMQGWHGAFAPHDMEVAQLLLTAGDSEQRRRYLNARATLETLLSAGVIPVINENDTVSTDEIRVGDNDRLAARVAQMAGADLLVLLSDVDGLYDADPRSNTNANHIAEIHAITPEIEAMAGKNIAANNRGGMPTKLAAAKIAMQSGCDMVIARGHDLCPLQKLATGARHSRFIAEGTPHSARKRWIAGHLKPSGIIVVDDGAIKALQSGNSLLPAGVIAIDGDFERGDAVWIKNEKGYNIGIGLSSYDVADAVKLMGKNTAEIENILGFRGRPALIHRDDMALDC